MKRTTTERTEAMVEGTSTPSAIKRFLRPTLGGAGIVFGVICTSPLYTLREAVVSAGGEEPSREAVLGAVSLILWALILIVTLKYVLVLLRVDNNGEGGTLTLMALALGVIGRSSTVLYLGIAGVAFFFCYALITPVISVLSGMEGIDVVNPALHAYTVPLAISFLVFLFVIQSRGTERVAAWFGPIMVIWLLVIGLAGLPWVLYRPEALRALSPVQGLSFLASHGMVGYFTVGSVFLAVAGAEALYPGLGHFGRKPIQTAWFALIFPMLVLNYLGQASVVLSHPEAIANPFFLILPDWARLPVVALSAGATAIASQAVIPGTYSLARQAVQLGLLPRLEVRHTSAEREGQIYLPLVNLILLIGAIFLVGMYQSSSALVSAYGVAASGTMAVTTCMAFLVIWKCWNWSLLLAASLMVPFLIIDAVFFSANLIAIGDGGWITLAFAAALSIVMYTWHNGTRLLSQKMKKMGTPLDDLLRMLERRPPQFVPGTAVFLTSDPNYAPSALLHMLEHYKVLHEHNVILTVITEHAPHVSLEDRVKVNPIGGTFSRVTLRFGYMESANIPRALAIARKLGWKFDIMSTSFLLSRRVFSRAGRYRMPRWRERLLIALVRYIAADAVSYFQVPTDRTIEVGIQAKV
jgi:KUP system potassium uptake protein